MPPVKLQFIADKKLFVMIFLWVLEYKEKNKIE